jgi:hypothetical protein
VDGFYQDEAAGEGGEGGVVHGCFFAAESDPLEALQLADGLLDASAGLVDLLREEGRSAARSGAAGDDGADAARSGRLPVAFRIIALIGQGGARDVWADVEEDLEVPAVAGLSARKAQASGWPSKSALR